MKTRTLSTACSAVALFGAVTFAPSRAEAIGCSATNICVRFNLGAYELNTGAGYVSRPRITVAAAAPVTFLLDGSLGSHPFYVTDSPTGGGGAVGTQYTTPQDTSGNVAFTPLATMATTIYYNCSVHPNLGGAITVTGGTDAGTPVADAGSDAGRDASADGGSSSSSSGGADAATSSSSSSSGAGASSSSSGSAGKSGSGATSTTVTDNADDGGCSVGAAAGSAWLGMGFVALANAIQRRRRARKA